MKNYLIIGAGILGATTAYKLAKYGAQVTIIDRKAPGQATEAAAGIICPWLSQRRNKAWYTLAKNGARMYPALIKELNEDGIQDTGYTKSGALSIHNDEAKLQAMKKRAEERRQDAPEIGEISFLNEEETRELFPPIAEGYQSIHISGAGSVDGKKLRDALLKGAILHGAKFVEGEATLSLEGQLVTGAIVNETHYAADIVIATAGAWMKQLLEPTQLLFNGKAQKGQLIHITLPDMDTTNWPLVMPPIPQSIVPFADHITLGATHEDAHSFDLRPTIGAVHDILSKALQFAPGLANSTLVDVKVGYRPFTPGFLPVFGKVPELQGLLMANGLGSSGLTTGPYVGSELAKLALGLQTEINAQDYNVGTAF
ncbi:NAD(P)/FAD-dependent oxidoreductase [Virgibacillus sp. MG-45]|uniref:NAD(P)/FAD-dependent oxidoreductase n=1 Tax=Virgibacillus sp. MG-45 TaxID=3102791 RepID=UPI002EDA4112